MVIIFSWWYLFYLADFVIGRKGEIYCPTQYYIVKTIQDCRTAAADLGITVANENVNSKSVPKGCYVNNYNNMYFNSHATGSATVLMSSVCKHDGGMNVFLSLIYILSIIFRILFIIITVHRGCSLFFHYFRWVCNT